MSNHLCQPQLVVMNHWNPILVIIIIIIICYFGYDFVSLLSDMTCISSLKRVIRIFNNDVFCLIA